LMLGVRDIDGMLAKVKQHHVSIATPGEKPVIFPDGSRGILIRDVDNRLIVLIQPASLPDAAADGPIVDLQILITVSDMERTVQVYRDVLGFRVDRQTTFTADQTMRALTGLSNAEVRRSRVQAPGSQLWIQFAEFKGVDRAPLRMRIQDRGAARLQLRTEH